MKDRVVLMFAFLFPPTAAAGTFRTLRFVRYLPEFGWNSSVITVPPECTMYGDDLALAAKIPQTAVVRRTNVRYPDKVIDAIADKVGLRRRKANNARQEAGGAPSADNALPASGIAHLPGRLLRNLRDLLFFTPDRQIAWAGAAIRASREMLHKRPAQVIYSSGPPHSTHLIALRFKRITGLPWVADFRDPWARGPWGEVSQNPWGQRLSGWLERRCVAGADAVILNTDATRQEFCRHYGDSLSQKFLVIPNGYDPEDRHTVERILCHSTGSSNAPIRICHPGALYGARDPRPFLMALKQLIDEGLDVTFEQIGVVESSYCLGAFLAEHALEKHVTITKPVDHEAVLRRMAVADLLLVIQPGTSLQVPGKLYEMLLFRKPLVVLTGPGETQDIVMRYNLGEIADPTNVAEVARSLRNAAHRVAGTLAGSNEAIAAYDGRLLTKRLANVFEAVTGQDAVKCACPTLRHIEPRT